MPGSEADSGWWFVSYPGEDELPSAGRFSELAGCDSPEGGVSRQDFDATLDQLGDVQPWMDRSQKKSARGFARLQKLFHRRYDELAIYRCETDTAEVPIYFGDATGEPVADRIYGELKEAPEGMTRTRISNLFKGHKDSAEIDRPLETLLTSGKARRGTGATGGRPAERWFAA